MDYQRIINTFISGQQVVVYNISKICRRLLRSFLRFATWTCRYNLLANVAPRYFVEVTPPNSEYLSINDDEANLGKCKESKSFTSVLDRLELDAELEARNEIPLRRTSDAQTEPSDDFEQELYSVNAKDVLPCRQVLHNPDILYFQGVRYPPEDIATFWKKDSRMWLWKSIRLMRKRNQLLAATTCETNNNTEEKE